MAARDIVQFVKFNDFKTAPPGRLAKEVLVELPEQMLGYEFDRDWGGPAGDTLAIRYMQVKGILPAKGPGAGAKELEQQPQQQSAPAAAGPAAGAHLHHQVLPYF
jgi:hypothetical protein